MASEREQAAQKEQRSLLESAFARLKENDRTLSGIDANALFRIEYYYRFRELYRGLLLQILKLEDSNPVKKVAYAFMNEVLERDGCFDASVILAMSYQRISPLTTKLLCDNAQRIGRTGVGCIILNTMQRLLAEETRYDVLEKSASPLSPKEIKQVERVVKAFSAVI